jgi:osmotically-inducible protein OsmY
LQAAQPAISEDEEVEGSMATGYDERDDERYDERGEDRRTRRDEYDAERTNRYERGERYGAPRATTRYGAARGDYDAEEYGRDYDSRDLRTRDYDDDRGEAYGGYQGRDYRAEYERGPAARDYDRPADYTRGRADYGRAYGYARDYGRERGRDYYTGPRPARGYDYDDERAPRAYNYDTDRADWSRTRERRREDEERGRDARGAARGKERGWWERVTDEVASWFGDEDAERRRLRDERQRGAHHRGRGPRGYRRSDERIREDINDRLTDHPYIDATDVEVSVASGEVTLTGAVESRQAKRLAEDIAESVSGVTNVENRLRVNRGAFDTVEPQALPKTDTTPAVPTTTTTGALPPPTTDAAETTRVAATSAGAGTTGTSTPTGTTGTGRSKTTTT